MEFIKVEEAIKKIAPFVGLDASNDTEKMFLYLDLAQKKAWKNGSYKGFLKEFDVKVDVINGNRFLRTPHGYNVLMGLNLNTKPIEIKDSYFQFHHNSRGSLTKECMLSFVNYALSYNQYATLRGPQILTSGKPFKVIAVATSDEEAKTTISGVDYDGNPIYSEKDGKRIHGANINLKKDVAKKLELWFSDISAIQKDTTRGPVNYYAADEDDNLTFIARIEPHQTRSMYRMYQIPKDCQCHQSVHALFKISEPDPILSLEQRLIIDDMESLMSLVIGMDKSFEKGEIQIGEAFLTKGIIGLDAENDAGKSPTVQPIQYIGLDDDFNDTYFH